MRCGRHSLLSAPGRIQGIDLARGLAIVGMFAAHLTVTPSFEYRDPTTWSALVNGHSAILFATLAGVSLALSIALPNPSDLKSDAVLRGVRRNLASRAAVIWIIGIALVGTGVPVNVILPAYGILFLLAAGLINLRTRTLVILAGVLAVTMPVLVTSINIALGGETLVQQTLVSTVIGWFYPFPVWLTFLVIGLVVGRTLRTSRNLLRSGLTLTLVGGVSTVAGHGVISRVADRAEESGGPALLSALRDEPHSSGIGEVVGSGGFALAVTGACVLLCLTPLSRIFWPVRVLGSMPLTAYTAHLVVWIAWAFTQNLHPGSDRSQILQGFRDAEPFWLMTIGIVVACCAWALTVGKGPMEILVGRASAMLSTRSAATNTETDTGTVTPLQHH
ncbi:heparan-alpha-glucosaminide N-acetyltransferase domain-containing protein [Corynebacterium sp. AOP40-9SA-29]|uniref:heparan-alpha-glucosaminide N-acetyltransferase domain-containing protein n=1 Tax=Corynebacterium sp. AOP40-9SA-29 TaxID=3457677 RepID=UPI004033362F